MKTSRLIAVVTALAVLFIARHAAALPDHVDVTVNNPYTGKPVVLSLDRYNMRAADYQVRIYNKATKELLDTAPFVLLNMDKIDFIYARDDDEGRAPA